MKILIDTREQSPLEFKHKYITEIIPMKLEVGDYGCRYENGIIPKVIFERKSIGDLFGTLGKGYERFKKEIVRAKDYDIKLILIIEGSITDIMKGSPHSSIKGFSIIKKLFTLWIRYNLMPVFCGNREECSQYIMEYYMAIGRNTDFNADQTLQDNRE